jgi:hypothetical protein
MISNFTFQITNLNFEFNLGGQHFCLAGEETSRKSIITISKNCGIAVQIVMPAVQIKIPVVQIIMPEY